MDLYVLDKTLNAVTVIDDYSSIIWVKRYYEYGDFELYLPCSIYFLEVLKIGYYIQRNDDDTIMIIESIDIKTDAENGNYITVKGRSIESLLCRRIVWQQTIFAGYVENLIYKLLEENIINPPYLLSSRKIDNFILGQRIATGKVITKQITYDNLYQAISDICKSYGLGFKVTLNTNKEFVFSLYTGIDRSFNQSINDIVVFSPDFDNIIDSEYEKNILNYNNVALVGGEGEGKSRTLKIVDINGNDGTNFTGVERFEMFVDAKQLSTNSEPPMTYLEYQQALREKGLDELNKNNLTTKFSGTLETGALYKYKINWNIGDYVQVINEFNISGSPQIIEVIENEDETGYKIIPTFSEWSE